MRKCTNKKLLSLHHKLDPHTHIHFKWLMILLGYAPVKLSIRSLCTYTQAQNLIYICKNVYSYGKYNIWLYMALKEEYKIYFSLAHTVRECSTFCMHFEMVVVRCCKNGRSNQYVPLGVVLMVGGVVRSIFLCTIYIHIYNI